MIELLPAESSAWSAVQSPRISFSHDFPNSGDGIPVDRRPLLDSNSDFRFFSGEPPLADDSHSRSADELFSNGRILPANHHRQKPQAPPPPAPARETLRDVMRTPQLGSDESSSKPPPQGSSSKAAFWRFGRSSSLNSYGGSRRSLLGKLPLLHRSNSTGSSNQTQKKDHNKSTPKPKRLPPPPPPPYSSSSSSSVSSLPKPLPPAKKAGGRVNPVLNVPPPYISAGTTNLFGFGYFFRQSRECTTTTTSGKSRKKTTT